MRLTNLSFHRKQKGKMKANFAEGKLHRTLKLNKIENLPRTSGVTMLDIGCLTHYAYWQEVSGINNPCPDGWRIPTEANWQAEILSWSEKNYHGAFASPLKLTAGGDRASTDGLIYDAGNLSRYTGVLMSLNTKLERSG